MRAEAGRETVKLDSWLLTCRVVLIEVLLISNIAHHCVLSTTCIPAGPGRGGAGTGRAAPAAASASSLSACSRPPAQRRVYYLVLSTAQPHLDLLERCGDAGQRGAHLVLGLLGRAGHH